MKPLCTSGDEFRSVMDDDSGETGDRMRTVKDRSQRGQRSRWARWLVGMMALMMAAPLVIACGDDLPGPPPDRDRRGGSDTDEVAEVDFDEYDDFEEAEEYSRPDYPVRRNPFRPNVDVLGTQEEEESEDQMRPVEPLEQYGLNSLSLVTIISETTVPKAMFVDPSGYGHFAKEGDRIGRNNGVIQNIRQNEVEIREGDERGSSVTVRMRERELGTGDESLSEEEQEALRRLLETEGGREALERSYREMAESERDQSTREVPAEDGRFPGLAPPRQNQ